MTKYRLNNRTKTSHISIAGGILFGTLLISTMSLGATFSERQTEIADLRLSGGGYVTQLLPANIYSWDDPVYASSDVGGIFWGRTGEWSSINQGLEFADGYAVRSLFVDSIGNLWASAGKAENGVTNLGGVFQLAGADWEYGSWSFVAGRDPGAQIPSEYEDADLTFDGAFDKDTHGRTGPCTGSTSWRAIATGSTFAENTNTGDLFVASTRVTGSNTFTSKVWKRTTGGSWSTLATTGTDEELTSLATLPSAPQVLLIGSIDASSPYCALSYIDTSASNPTRQCLTTTFGDVRDIATATVGSTDVLYVAAGGSGVWRNELSWNGTTLSLNRSSQVVNPSDDTAGSSLKDCTSDIKKGGVFTSVDVNIDGFIAASELGGTVLVSVDDTTTWTLVTKQANRYSYSLGTTPSLLGTSTVEHFTSDLSYQANFLASVAGVAWSGWNLYAGDFYGVWSLDSTLEYAERSYMAPENTVVESVAVSPNGAQALIGKDDAPVLVLDDGTVGQNSWYPVQLSAIAPGSGETSSAAASTTACTSAVQSIRSVVWPDSSTAVWTGADTTASSAACPYLICEVTDPAGTTPVYAKMSTTGLPTGSAASSFGLGYSDVDTSAKYFVSGCDIYSYNSGSTSWTRVYTPSSTQTCGTGLTGTQHSAANIRVVNIVSPDGTHNTNLYIAALPDRVVYSTDGTSWSLFDNGLYSRADGTFAGTTESQTIGQATTAGGYQYFRLTAAHVHSEDEMATIYVGTMPGCKTWQAYSSGSGTPCATSDMVGGVYKRTISIDNTGAISSSASWTNLLNPSTPNVTIDGAANTNGVAVTGIHDFGDGRLAFTSRVLGKIVTMPYVPHMGGLFLSEDSGSTWARVGDEFLSRSTQLTSLAGDDDGNLWVGTQGNGVVRYRVWWPTCDSGTTNTSVSIRQSATYGYSFRLGRSVSATSADADIAFSWDSRRTAYKYSTKNSATIAYPSDTYAALDSCDTYDLPSIYTGGRVSSWQLYDMFIQTNDGRLFKAGNFTYTAGSPARVTFDWSELQWPVE